MRLAPVASLAVLAATSACRNDRQFIVDIPTLEVEVFTPTYGEFLGDAPITVTGRVTPPAATLTVEGEAVAIADDGTFTTTLPVGHAYRIVDVEAAYDVQYERIRVPVFRGHDPVESWPGGLTMRLTPAGMERLGLGLGAMIDALGWEQMILDAIPSTDLGWLWLGATHVTHDPTAIELVPATSGMDMLVAFRKVDIHFAADFDVWGQQWSLPITVGYQRIGIGARAIPAVDGAGMLSLALQDANIVMQDPSITVAGLDAWLLEILLDGLGQLIEPIGQVLLDAVLDQFGSFDLGGPYVFETDLLGVPVEARLSDVFGDLGGLGAGLGLGLGEPATVGVLPIPVPTTLATNVHAQLGLHEGLLHLALVGGLLDMLTQDLELPGAIGELMGNAARNLPGGEDAPTDTEGWCLSVQPMDARVVRLQTGLMPWVVLYLPDVIVDLGYRENGACVSWLVTSLAFEVGLDVRAGRVISLDMQLPEGAVLEYGAQPGWEEGEVVSGLATFLNGALGLLGGQFQMDLGDLMGGLGDASGNADPLLGALGDLDLKIVDSQPVLDASGAPIEGLYAVSLQLWQP